MASTTSCLDELLATREPAGLGPGPRDGVRPAAGLNSALDDVLEGAAIPAERAELIRAAILLWHDHLDASHEISQRHEDADGSYLHAIMHRREPDYSNAKYWFRRVGAHPCFSDLSVRVAALLKSRGQTELESQLIPNGRWDAFAFVDACAAAARHPDDHRAALLRDIQKIEFAVLVQFLRGG